MRTLIAALALAFCGGEALAQAAPAAQPATPPSAATAPAPTADDWAADRYFDPRAMAAARRALTAEHGGQTYSRVLANLAEYRSGADGGYHWDGEAWIGGDLQRLVLKTEGEGAAKGKLESGEAQALYSRAIGPYFDLLAGVRQDVIAHGRTYAALGVEGLAPYRIETEVQLFLSDRGELLARATAWSDLRVTQRLILQPRVEANLAAQDTRAIGVGSGLSDAELGLRLRYEVTRQFAPYVGVVWTRRFGAAADYRRANGERVEQLSLAAGLRAWF
jgi:copper resistance protein B